MNYLIKTFNNDSVIGYAIENFLTGVLNDYDLDEVWFTETIIDNISILRVYGTEEAYMVATDPINANVEAAPQNSRQSRNLVSALFAKLNVFVN